MITSATSPGRTRARTGRRPRWRSRLAAALPSVAAFLALLPASATAAPENLVCFGFGFGFGVFVQFTVGAVRDGAGGVGVRVRW